MAAEEKRWRPWINKSTTSSNHDQCSKTPLNLSLKEQILPHEAKISINKSLQRNNKSKQSANGRKPLDLSVKKSYLNHIEKTNDGNKKARRNVSTEKKTEESAFMSEPPKLRLIKDVLAQGIKLVGRVHPHPTVSSRKKTAMLPPPPAPPPKRSKVMEGVTIKKPSLPITSPSHVVQQPHESKMPKGKLCYMKETHNLLRYIDETEKELFVESLHQCSSVLNNPPQGIQIIRIPPQVVFSDKDNISVEEYVVEMTNVEKFIPKDFFLFYKFVTGYQICNNNLPVSFSMFLKLYNTSGLNKLLAKYVGNV